MFFIKVRSQLLMVLLIKLNTIIIPFLSALHQQRLSNHPGNIHLEIRLRQKSEFDLPILLIPPHLGNTDDNIPSHCVIPTFLLRGHYKIPISIVLVYATCHLVVDSVMEHVKRLVPEVTLAVLQNLLIF